LSDKAESGFLLLDVKSPALISRLWMVLLMACGCAMQAATPTEGLTAQESLDAAGRFYLEGKYDEAADLYAKFLGDFGQSQEAAEAIRRMRYRHAMCQIHRKKFGEAIEPIAAALAQQPPLQTSEIQELQFWLGVAHLEDKNYPEARRALEKFLALFPAGAEKNPASLRQSPSAMKIPEAKILIGSSWLLEEKLKEAAAYLEGIKAGMIPENRSRAVILHLHALLEDNQNEAAMKVIGEEFPHWEDLVQLITFQGLTLELGNRWLEAGESRKAIQCLQRVWESDRLLKHQQARLEDLQSRLQAAEADSKSDPYTKFLLTQLIRKVTREIENFQKIEAFDAALRLRLATAYQTMGRYRESALILEDMLARMPPGKIVEQASVNLVQAWFEIERWPKVLEASQAFAAKFPESPSLPLVEYLAGVAAQKDRNFDEAIAHFDRIQAGDSDFAPRAHFMKGFTLLLDEKNREAITTFEKFQKKYPDHEMAEDSAYWRGMGYSLDRQFEKSRRAMDDYLRKFRGGRYAGSATFRKAYCAQQLEDYETSIKELRSFLRTFPRHEEDSAARILLGDALMNEGRMEDGIAAFKDIPKSDTKFHEEGVFKTGKALKLMEKYDRYLGLMQDFQKENPRSPRVAEAIYNIGWTHRQNMRPDKAREVYWDAIKKYGDDPTIRSVEDLFPALAKLYKGDPDARHYLSLLQDLKKEAEQAKKETLVMRTLWAQAAALQKNDPDTARNLLLAAARFANVQTTNPLLLADFAAACAGSGRPAEATALYRDLVKWNPRAPQKDRALAALGFIEMEQGNSQAAMKWFERFKKESQPSLETGRVFLAMAALQEKSGKNAEARKSLEAVLSCELSTGSQKAEALFRIGQIHMAEGNPKLAIPYFQRIYVMHGRWHDWVARAYVRSGEAFEKLHDTSSARRTYQELVENESLSGMPETGTAKKRLEALGGPLPPQPPAQG